MAGGGSTKPSNASRVRKRVEAETTETETETETSSPITSSLKRAKDGSAFVRCDGCNKSVAVALITMHDCGFEAKLKMNLESQVVEMPTEVKKKPIEKKKPSTTRGKKSTKAKDPNKPKRPPTAFFVFMGDFRKTFKEENPDNKSVSVVAKEGGLKWKDMSDEEKKPYIDKAAELKAEYEKTHGTKTTGDEDEEVSQEEEASAEKPAEVENVSDDDE